MIQAHHFVIDYYNHVVLSTEQGDAKIAQDPRGSITLIAEEQPNNHIKLGSLPRYGLAAKVAVCMHAVFLLLSLPFAMVMIFFLDWFAVSDTIWLGIFNHTFTLVILKQHVVLYLGLSLRMFIHRRIFKSTCILHHSWCLACSHCRIFDSAWNPQCQWVGTHFIINGCGKIRNKMGRIHLRYAVAICSKST